MTIHNKMRVELGEPEHGWIRVSLSFSNESVEFDASYIYDSITELALVVSSLVEGGDPEREVWWTQETDSFDFRFSTCNDDTTLRVFQSPDGFMKQKDGELIFQATLDRLEMALSF